MNIARPRVTQLDERILPFTGSALCTTAISVTDLPSFYPFSRGWRATPSTWPFRCLDLPTYTTLKHALLLVENEQEVGW